MGPPTRKVTWPISNVPTSVGGDVPHFRPDCGPVVVVTSATGFDRWYCSCPEYRRPARMPDLAGRNRAPLQAVRSM
jgi:hypothetical protein